MGQGHSFAIRSARHDSTSANYNYRSARALRFPSLSLSAVSFGVNELQTVEAIPGGLEIGSKDNYQADLKISVPLYTGGRLSGQIKARRALWEAGSYNLEAARLGNAYQCRQAWLTMNMTGALVRSAEASLKRLIIIRNDVNNLYVSGLADSVDILEAELAYQKAEQMLLQARTNQEQAAIGLAQLIGVEDDTTIELDNSIPDPTDPDLKQRLFQSEDIERPELKAAVSRTQMAQHSIGISRAAYLPSISAFGGYSVGKPNRDYFEASWNDYFSAGLMLNWEFNLGGGFIHNVQSAKHSFYSARMNQKVIEEHFITGAKIARENFRQAYREFEIVKKEYEITKHKFRLGRKRHEAGAISVNRFLELEAELTVAEQMYHASKINFYIMKTEYLYAIGSTKIYGGL
jgi:outer membrane protein TolC